MKNVEFFILQTYSFPEISEFVVYSYLFSYASSYPSDLLENKNQLFVWQCIQLDGKVGSNSGLMPIIIHLKVHSSYDEVLWSFSIILYCVPTNFILSL